MYIDVIEFSEDYIKKLMQFQRYWLHHGFEDPDEWPCQLTEDQWLEEFEFYIRNCK